jgi:hypothetical protein
MGPNLILGEAAGDIARELERFEAHLAGQGSFEIEPNGPLQRALMRAEAELLVADALAMRVGTYEARTDGARRHDALLLVVSRMAGHQRAA